MNIQLTSNAQLTTDNSASSYAIPVLEFNGQAYGPGDALPFGQTAGRWVSDIVSGGIRAWWDSAVARNPEIGLFTKFQN